MAPGVARGTERVLTLQAPGRLHLGFLDPGASLGRRFGSLGLVVDGFETELALSAADTDRVSAASTDAQAEIERASMHLHTLRQRSGRHQPLHLRLLRVLPAHAGFGSGTQLALAVGRAFAQWHGLDLPTITLAQWLARGLRSGVGIAGFEQGGLLLDGGPSLPGTPAPLLSRIALPEAWRIVIVCDPAHRGLSGGAEQRAIAQLPPLPQADAADICHQVLMRVLPGAACAEFEPFAIGINRIQRLLGAHFAPAQGGNAYTSAVVGKGVRWMGDASGADTGAAIGQSSWGPTGFVIVPTQSQAEALVQSARAANVLDPALSVCIVSGRNHGATINERSAPTQPPQPS
jgi:beta-ribofuranosylaminobenzene 5'-phosphate synthase